MMLEKGEKKEKREEPRDCERQTETTTTGVFDRFRRTRRARPITTCNRFEAFTTDDDSDDEIDNDADTTDIEAHERTRNKHKPNKRQRQRHKEQFINALLDDTTPHRQLQTFPWQRKVPKELDFDGEAARDAAANGSTREEDCIGISDGSTIEPHQLQAHSSTNANRHSTGYIKHMSDNTHKRQQCYQQCSETGIHPNDNNSDHGHDNGDDAVDRGINDNITHNSQPHHCMHSRPHTQQHHQWLKSETPYFGISKILLKAFDLVGFRLIGAHCLHLSIAHSGRWVYHWFWGGRGHLYGRLTNFATLRALTCTTPRWSSGRHEARTPNVLGRGFQRASGGIVFWNPPGVRSTALSHIGFGVRVIAQGRPFRGGLALR